MSNRKYHAYATVCGVKKNNVMRTPVYAVYVARSVFFNFFRGKAHFFH